MIGSILMCDQCGDTDGARAAGTGQLARRSMNRGGSQRVTLGHRVLTPYASGVGRERVVKVDLCRRHRTAAHVAELRARELAKVEHDQRRGLDVTWRPAA